MILVSRAQPAPGGRGAQSLARRRGGGAAAFPCVMPCASRQSMQLPVMVSACCAAAGGAVRGPFPAPTPRPAGAPPGSRLPSGSGVAPGSPSTPRLGRRACRGPPARAPGPAVQGAAQPRSSGGGGGGRQAPAPPPCPPGLWRRKFRPPQSAGCPWLAHLLTAMCRAGAGPVAAAVLKQPCTDFVGAGHRRPPA